MTKEEAYNLVYNKLNFCGCGNPESVLTTIKTFLQLLVDRKAASSASDVVHNFKNITLSAINNAHIPRDEYGLISDKIYELLLADTRPDLYYFFLYAMDGAGLTEHGSSVGGCWITDLGLEFLGALNKYGINEILDYEQE